MVAWMMILLQLVLPLVLVVVASPSPSFSSSSVNTVMCRPDERDALLFFKAAFSIANSSYCEYAKTESWEKNGDCCKWNGVVCDNQTGHMVELDLSLSCLSGSFPANTTLFRLPHLRYLSLGSNFLSGQVPHEIGLLSHLTTLDLSLNDQVEMPNFETIIANLTNMEELDLSEVSIASNLPPSIFNFSKLTYIGLSNCGLKGEFPGADVNTSMLARVIDIDMEYNMLSGVIPKWLFTHPSLNSLYLSHNLFTRISEFPICNTSSLTSFEASSNQLNGRVPDGIFELHNLQALYLDGNNLTGTIPLSNIQKLQSLNTLFLSDNRFSIIDDTTFYPTPSSWPSFDTLSLSSCNLGHFPNFLRGQANLTWLELSNNDIHDSVPNWISTLGALERLNLSHNLLQGGLEHLPWQSLDEIDIQNNLFHGVVPVPFHTTTYFWASNNQFSGAIPPSLCNVNELRLLDLAQNNLTGRIPNCFASFINDQLEVLDLRKNQLHGPIPSSLFQECPVLSALSLSGNKFEGQIPQSINNCSQVQLLDLSNNNLDDIFPYWLGNLPSLKVLILSSNKLHGSLTTSNTMISFQMLQILDISNNAFTSNLPIELLTSMKAMAKVDNSLSLSYMSSGSYYQDSIMTWIKGVNRRLDAIYDNLVLIDASRNKLEGLIPDAIGDLVSLRGLNLAHNNFTGVIPPSLSNLTLLESLDLSFNSLDGGIPNELVNLNLLEFFNVSENNLSGHVPTTKQFGTFSDPSYLGNPGLCGPWLTNKCGKPSNTPPNLATSEGSSDDSSGLQVWEIFLIGCGCGLLGGLAWGYIIFWMNCPYWLQNLIFQIQTIVIRYHQIH